MPSWRHTLAVFAPLLLTLLHGTGVQSTALVTKAPVSVNASLGSVATFTCEATVTEGTGVFWVVRGADPNTVDRSSEGNVYIVTIGATEENDGVLVVCRIINSEDSKILDQSEPAILRIQGLLDSPSNLTVSSMDANVIALTWNEPPTLDLTNIHPDINHYTVYITNGSHSWSDNVTWPQHSFTGIPGKEGLLNPCSTYSFSVSAWNVVGEGNRSSSVKGYFEIYSAVQEVTIEEVYFIHGSTPRISASIRLDDGHLYCPESRADTITAVINCQFGHFCTQRFEYNSLYSSTVMLTVSTHNCIIPTNTQCEIGFSTVNSVTTGQPEPIITAQFSTHDVQQVKVMQFNDLFTIVCTFARGSEAHGCVLQLTSADEQYTYNCSLQIEREDPFSPNSSATLGRLPADVPSGDFSLSVFDVEGNGTVAGSPAYQHSTIIALTSSQSDKPSDLQCMRTSLNVGNEDNDSGDDSVRGYIVGTIGGVLFLTALISVALTITYWYCKRKGKLVTDNDMRVQENASYEVVTMHKPQQQQSSDGVGLEDCPAYGTARK